MLIGGQSIVIDYPYAKFGNFNLSRFGFIMQTHRQRDRITEADDCHIHAAAVGMSNYQYR